MKKNIQCVYGQYEGYVQVRRIEKKDVFLGMRASLGENHREIMTAMEELGGEAMMSTLLRIHVQGKITWILDEGGSSTNDSHSYL